VVPTVRLVGAKATSLRAAAAQQLCSTKPHEPPRTSPPTLMEHPCYLRVRGGYHGGDPSMACRGQKLEPEVSQAFVGETEAGPGSVDRDRPGLVGAPAGS
jgi:hypothetical protein